MPPSLEDKKKTLMAQLQVKAEKGQVIFYEGEQSNELYILLAGALEIRRGDQVIAVVDEKDTYLGEMSTLLGLPRTATVAAAADSLLVRVPEEKVIDFFNHSPQLGLKLAKILADRLNGMNEKHRKLLETMGTPDYDSVALYERLVCTPIRKQFMRVYSQKIGSALPADKIAAALKIAAPELERIATDYETAGLLRSEGGNIHFLATENESLKRQIQAFAASQK